MSKDAYTAGTCAVETACYMLSRVQAYLRSATTYERRTATFRIETVRGWAMKWIDRSCVTVEMGSGRMDTLDRPVACAFFWVMRFMMGAPLMQLLVDVSCSGFYMRFTAVSYWSHCGWELIVFLTARWLSLASTAKMRHRRYRHIRLPARKFCTSEYIPAKPKFTPRLTLKFNRLRRQDQEVRREML